MKKLLIQMVRCNLAEGCDYNQSAQLMCYVKWGQSHYVVGIVLLSQ